MERRGSRPPRVTWRAPQAEADDVLISNSKHSVCNSDVEHVVFTPVSAELSSEPEPGGDPFYRKKS
jgi:hypothetical protein